MDKLVGSSLPFSQETRSLLRRIAILLIPKSEEHEIPGGNDDAIFSHFLELAGPNSANITQYLFDLQKKSIDKYGDSFLKLQNNQQIAMLHTCPNLLEVLMPHIAFAYYQDPRILSALSLKDSPPFPGGNVAEEGDWSLLDPVRKRKPLYRIP